VQSDGMPAGIMEHLSPFVGEWEMEAAFAAGGSADGGRTVFEWMFGGRFLSQRAEVPHPDAPDLLAIIAPDAAGAAYTQHYFDSRGVVRTYAMTFSRGVWTLLRGAPDFSPLGSARRFTATFGDGGATITGRWESSPDGTAWKHDFDLIYTRAG
jgi:hypothetical protein